MKYVVIGEPKKERAKRNPLFDKLGRPREKYTSVTSVEVAIATIKYMRRAKVFVGDSAQLAAKLKLGCAPRILIRLLKAEVLKLFEAGFILKITDVKGSQRKLITLCGVGQADSLPSRISQVVLDIRQADAEYRKKVYERSVSEYLRQERAAITALFRFMNSYSIATGNIIWIGSATSLWQEITNGMYLPHKRPRTPKYLEELNSVRALLRYMNKESSVKALERKGITFERREFIKGKLFWVIYWDKSVTHKMLAEKQEEYYTKLKEEEIHGIME